MRTCASCLAGAALTLLIAGGAGIARPPAAAAAKIEWQESVTPSYRIGIRDKFGELGEYDVSFTVTDGKNTWNATVHVKNDEWGFALFPDEFKGDAFANFNKVTYRWVAKVKGKVVGSGRFTLVAPPFD